jgi:hypothetical protein
LLYIFLIYPKSSEQKKIEGAALRCRNQNSQRYKVQHQERIDRLLDDGLKGLMIIIKV